jgi:uncharacterized protein with ParB-like and HNH nuclease domain
MSQDALEIVENGERENVIDEAESDDTVIPQRYDISSFGADYDVEGVVRRLKRGDIFIPSFQRDYVWRIGEASRFIESLLLGLPVPGVFLAKETDTNKLLVIDGQQRLMTLLFFYEGLFDPKPEEKTHRVFALTKVQKNLEGLTYEKLSESDRLKLDDSIIHATVVRQEMPRDEDTSIYHIFERLNNGGRKLTPQEIRVALYHGSLIDLIKRINDNEIWRSIYGKKSNRLKDQELILRFLALYFDHERYEAPMEEFINKFAAKHKNAAEAFLSESENIFINTLDVVFKSFGKDAFRPERALNAAVFDSVMVGLAKRVTRRPLTDYQAILVAYSKLFDDSDYIRAVFQATSNEASVETRITKSIQAFESL